MAKELMGYRLSKLDQAPLGKDFNDVCREICAEGIVLLKNDNNALPLQNETKVSIFGRAQNTYIKSGTGSGGAVNADYVVGIPEALTHAGIQINEKLANIYNKWAIEHPFKNTGAWSSEVCSMEEMPLTESIVKDAAKFSDTAIVIIGRTAGEDMDNSDIKGSFRLTDLEEDMLHKVCRSFKRTIVLLNVGNIINMNWVKKYNPSAVLYVWQGGQEGGNGVADILLGKVSPSGKLTDTIAYEIADYPSDINFGNLDKNYYCEDIYVGYRYFNTFARNKILYPFGYGLSYTEFEYSAFTSNKSDDEIKVNFTIKNIGRYPAKEVVQIYYSAPQGLLGKPERELVSFKKTKLLSPDESQKIEIVINITDMASFDDTGVTGFNRCFVLEKGEYRIFVSRNSICDEFAASCYIAETKFVKQCNRAMSPKENFKRIKPLLENERYIESEEFVFGVFKKNELREVSEIKYTGDKGIKLKDVKNGNNSMKEFIAQLSDDDLATISFGEGMNSPKVTGGTGCAFGGVSSELLKYGIPIACGSDGPSGIRMDCGAKATSLPIGTLLACSWNEELVERLYTYEGIEMAVYEIDVLLAPGINIHRHPLCGRNFEYFSEDPILTGKMASAVCKGINKSGNTATIKHFCCNNQEKNRHMVESVVSERALREIYLKAFELPIKLGVCRAVMTSYNPVNGHWSAANYDLTSIILRNEWGYKGFVMTDWWAKTDKDCQFWGRNDSIPPMNIKIMAEAHNDIYMVIPDASDHSYNNLLSSVKDGTLCRAVLQQNAMNICEFLINSNALERVSTGLTESSGVLIKNTEGNEKIFCCLDAEVEKRYVFNCDESGKYILKIDISSENSFLSQNTIIFYLNNEYLSSFTFCGTCGGLAEQAKKIELKCGEHCLKFTHINEGIKVKKIEIRKFIQKF